jgi:phosphoglycolate phosphatase-like HAD superfamily hydrolase
MELSGYATLVFDCDGVILDSNGIKTTAFFNAALPYGARAAEALVEYHRNHGGVSRHRKFEYLLRSIVGTSVDQPSLAPLFETYAREIRQGLRTCRIDPDLEPLRKGTAQARWMVVSGSDQDELREVFRLRNLTRYFEGGVFGSPDTKDQILGRELATTNIVLPALFIGDSRYDHEAALRAGLDFVFVSDWTDFTDWKAYQELQRFYAVPTLGSLLDQGSAGPHPATRQSTSVRSSVR